MKKKFLLIGMAFMLSVVIHNTTVLAQEDTPDIGNAAVRTESAETSSNIYIEEQNPDGKVEDILVEDPSGTIRKPTGYQGTDFQNRQEKDKEDRTPSQITSRSLQDTPSADFTYEKITSTTIAITGYSGGSTAVSIPAKINGLTVTKIGEQAFAGTGIESVVIPSAVNEIGEAAFYSCYALNNVTMPKNLKMISTGAFANCYTLEKIVLNEGLESIGDYAFQNTQIQKITIPSTLKSLGKAIFFNVMSFTCYAENKNPYYATIKGVLFSNDKKTLINYPCGKKDTTYTIPDSVTKVNEEAFLQAYYLQKVTYGTNVKTIGDWAFSGTGLTEFTLPSTVTSIGNGIVSECADLKRITVKDTKLTSLPFRFAYQCGALETVSLSGKISEIGQVAFGYCSNLTNVTLNSGLKTIGVGAFGECSSLKSIKLPSGLEIIAYQAFLNDINLAEVNIPSTVKAIYSLAFYNCPAWENIKSNTKLPNVTGDVYQEAQTLKVTGQANYTYAYRVLSLVNSYRKAAGVKTLSMDQELLDSAMQRAAEVAIYFSHDRPYGGQCFDVSNKMYGENIAGYQMSPEEVMNSWMNSEGHRANILDSDYNCIGIGCFYQNGTYYWVQCFGAGNVEKAVKEADSNITYTIYAIEDCVVPTFLAQTDKLDLNKQKRLVVYAQGTKIDPDSFNWKSSNTLVATVSNTGLVKTLAGGSTNISIANKTMSSVKTTIKVSVNAPKYTVTFQANGGSVSSTSKGVYKGNRYGTLPVPTRKGYEFVGWFTAKSGGSEILSTTIVTRESNQTLYAHWKKIKYTIKYVLNSGTNNTENPSYYYVTSDDIILQKPTRKGYTFQGWYTSNSYKTKITKITKGSIGNKTLYAKWSVNKYTIRYNKNGATSGSMADTSSCKYNTVYTLRENTFKRKGYTFIGWSTSSSGTVVYEDKASVKNLTSTNGAVKNLYAKWKVYTYKLTYHLNGGKNNENNPLTYNMLTDTVTLKNPTRTGYTFKGWYTDAEYKTRITEIRKGSTGSKSLYAKWTSNSYNLHYDANGGTQGQMQDMTSLRYGKEYTLNPNTFLRENYKFSGWNTKSDGSGKAYQDQAKVKNLTSSPGKTVVLYAQWQAVATEVNFGEHLIELKIGETYQLNPKIIPEDIKDVSLEYTTANVGVADVSEDGIITAIASGETEVSCRVRDNSSMESKVTVIVNELTSNQNMKDTLELDTGEKTVIQIHTAKELAAVSENLAGNYELKADLDLSGMEWKPLGDEENPFTGSFEGNGHSITGFVITDSSCVDYGLFGFMKGSVQNLVLDVKMQLGFSSGERDVYIGSITGRAEQSQLTNCISYTSISMENTKDLDLSFIHKNDTVGYCDAYTIITDCITYE